MKVLRNGLCLLLLAGASGCIQSSNEFILNPDGSGKVMHETTMQPFSFTGADDPDAIARETISKMMEDSTGIDAWSDVSFESNQDGTVTVRGTAYFPSANDVAIQAGGQDASDMEMKAIDNGDGTTTFSFFADPVETDAAADDAAATIADEDVAAEMQKARSQYKQSKPMMAAVLSGMRMESAFQLPGTIQKSSNLVVDGNRVSLVFDGNKVMTAMDGLYSDEASLESMVRAGIDPMTDKQAMIGDTFREALFGEPGPVEVTFDRGTTDQFDYLAEMQAAQANTETMLAALGIQAPIPIEAAPGGGFTNLVIGGVQWVRFDDSEDGIQPLNSQKGYQLSLVGRLAGAALDVEEGEVTEATADDGSSLLPESEWERKINFPRLSERKDRVIFEVPLLAPGEGVTGIRKLAGNLTYTVGSSTKELDLGFTSLTAGATGTELGAVIETVEDSSWSDDKSLTLKVATDPATIREIRFYDGQGTQLSVESAGYSSWGEEAQLSYSAKSFPESGKIVAVVYGDLVKYQAEFQIENIDLLGNPR